MREFAARVCQKKCESKTLGYPPQALERPALVWLLFGLAEETDLIRVSKSETSVGELRKFVE